MQWGAAGIGTSKGPKTLSRAAKAEEGGCEGGQTQGFIVLMGEEA